MFRDPYTKFFMNSVPEAQPVPMKKRESKKSAISYADMISDEDMRTMMADDDRRPLTDPETPQADEETLSVMGGLQKLLKSL